VKEVTLPELVGKTGLWVDGDWVETKDQDPYGNVRLLQLADIGIGEYLDKSSRFMTAAKATELRCTYLQAGDILIARMPDPVGRACIFSGDDKPCVTVVDVCVLRPDDEIVDRRWLVHQINSAQFLHKVSSHVRGATRQRISRSDLGRISLTLPSIEEQRRISATLDKADAVRKNRREAMKLFDEFLRSVFLDMFGDPVTNSKGLPIQPLGELIKLKSGDFLPSQNMVQGGGVPVYGGNGINGYHDQGMFQHRQVVIGRVGAYCGAVHVTEPICWVTDNALYVAEMDQRLTIDYLSFALRFARLNQYSNQVGQPLVSGSRIYPVTIPVPSNSAQVKFESILRKAESINIKQRLAIRESDHLFHSLQQQVFA